MSRVLSIIITYNASKWLDTCIGSLTNSDFPTDIVVVDNASSDDTVAMIRENYLDVIKWFFPLNENLGFGKAHNLAFSKVELSDYDYVFLLNQDAGVEPDAIRKLTEIMNDRPDIGICSPVHMYSDEIMDRAFSSYLAGRRVGKFRVKEQDCVEVTFVNAAIWLLRTEALDKVGYFNPIFDHYGEDSNYAQRLIHTGYKIIIATGVKGFHYRSQNQNGRELKSAGEVFYIENLMHLLNPQKKLLPTYTKSLWVGGKKSVKSILSGNFYEAYRITLAYFKLTWMFNDIRSTKYSKCQE
jgi:GT2 family glycosyltransferase